MKQATVNPKFQASLISKGSGPPSLNSLTRQKKHSSIPFRIKEAKVTQPVTRGKEEEKEFSVREIS